MKWKGFERQFSIFRQIVTFVLGVWVVVYAITSTGKDVGFILAGFALIGLIPVERFFDGVILVRQPREPKPEPEPSTELEAELAAPPSPSST
jgi:hypothetical protein